MDAEFETRLFGIIKRSFPANANELTAEIVRFELLEDKKSFWSKIVRAHLEWPADILTSSKDKHDFPKRVLIKIPIIGANVRTLDDSAEQLNAEQTLRELTENEVSFYQCLTGSRIPGFRTPFCYLAEEIGQRGTGCLVLEDMQLTLGHIFSEEYLPGYSFQQVDHLMRALASFHHFFLTRSDDSWKTQFDSSSKISDGFQKLMLDNARELANEYPDLFNKQFNRIAPLFEKQHAVNGRTEIVQGVTPVIAHLDLNPSNVLWKGDRKNCELGAIIDFQLSALGSPCEDIVRILSIGLSADDRRQYQEKALSLYHESLSSLYGGSPPFTLKQTKAEYNRVFAHACNFSLFGLSCYHGQMKGEAKSDERDVGLMEYARRAYGLVEDIIIITPEDELAKID